MKKHRTPVALAMTPISAMVLALGMEATVVLLAPAAQAKICYMPNGHPYECQDWIPANAAVPPGPGNSTSDLDSLFLNTLTAHRIGTADGNSAVLINAGKAICQNLDTGATGAQEVGVLQRDSKLRPDQAQAFVAAAVGTYCPQHSNRHDLLGTQ